MPASLTRPSFHPLSCAQLPPSNWSMHLPAWLVWPPLQRVLPRWLLWRRLPAALRLSEWRRLPQHHWELHLCPRLHGKTGGVSHGSVPPTLTPEKRGQLLLSWGGIGECGPVPRDKECECLRVPLRHRACDWRALKAVFRGPVLLGCVVVKVKGGVLTIVPSP